MPLNATNFLTSNLLNADGLESGVRIEAIVVSVRPREFEDGETKLVVYTDYEARGIVCNQTRLKALIAAYGPNPDNWIGKTIVISRGSTLFAGREVPAVKIEPIGAVRIAGSARPAISDTGDRRGPPSAPPVDVCDGPDNDPDGD